MAENAPLISVLMPVYNAGRYVADAVESVLSQTLGDFEFLILDDGSTDDSLGALRRYEGRDPRIRLIARPNRGVSASLRELVEQSRGALLARMDADDVALPDRFARQAEYLRAHPDCVLVGSRVLVIDPEGDPLCDWCTEQGHEAIEARYLRAERVTPISHPSVMMRREAVLNAGNYRPYALEDVDLFLRLGERGRLVNLPEVLLRYRIHAGNVSKTAAYHDRIDGEFREIVRAARQRRGLPEADGPPPPPRPRVDPTPTEEREKWAWWALGAGHLATARKHARWVLAHAPLSPRSWKLMYCVSRGY